MSNRLLGTFLLIMENKLLYLLASKMLELASDKFSNHGCNDLDQDVIDLIADNEALFAEMRKYNGDNKWPQSAYQIGDDSLMSFLSEKLRIMAQS